ncbi:lecithin retinol acyltransferase family protein [Photobacterium swingsii]|uniref:lecithin retinol acyltransferase family protein n=1 Tax=Photobacterium swingsii TaxID=680026 RepID=UPI004068ED9A
MNLVKIISVSLLENLAQSLYDNLFNKTPYPIRGSVVYCDLAFGHAEHSGIYIGDDQIVHRNKYGLIEIVSSRGFLAGTTAITIYVSCDCNGRAVGDEDIAILAESMVGSFHDYSLLSRNCHQFCSYCLNGNWSNSNVLLTQLKSEAKLFLRASQWRAWDLLHRP